MSFDFKGRLFLVTGASRGLGWDLSKAIAAAGGEVYALARDKDSLDNLVKESERIHPILADLNDWEGTRAELEKLEALDGVVNNAAVSFPAGDGLEVSKEIIENTFRVNVMGAINVIQTTAKKMKDAKKRGSIVNVSRSVKQFNYFCKYYRHSQYYSRHVELDQLSLCCYIYVSEALEMGTVPYPFNYFFEEYLIPLK